MLGLTAAVLLCAGASLAAIGVTRFQQSANYPGALVVSAHNIYQVSPSLYVRRDTSYRTADALPEVYHWYSRGFDLGPEAGAHGSCIMLERSTSQFIVEQYVGVMVCDTPTGRMMFVQRSLSLRYRR
jgi:hypothetical protein